jgi:hypothetical protein
MNNWIKKQIYHFTETSPDFEQAKKLLEDAKAQGVNYMSGKMQLSYQRQMQDIKYPKTTIDSLLGVIDELKPGIVQHGGQYKPYVKEFEATHTMIDAKRVIEHTLEIKTRCWGGNVGATGKVNDWLRIHYATSYSAQDK